MTIKLKDIPVDPLAPDDVETLASEEFDYADRERVSIQEARRKIREEFDAKQTRLNLMETNKIFGTTFEIPAIYNTDTISEGYGDFTFKEKAIEIAKAGHRGIGQIVKLPGIALKAIGEIAPTRAEREKLRQSPSDFKQTQARSLDSPLGKSVLKGYDMLRRAGNKYIETVSGFTFDESPESRAARQQNFLSAPFYRTSIAVSESAPSYGLAIAATLTSGNPNLGLYVLGTTTASSSYESLREQGIDPDLAIVGAALEGSIEMLTEKIPMDMLMKGGGRPFLIRALQLGTAESFQELFAQLGQNYINEVVKDVDPENLSTVANAARQEWAIITQGWQDAMSAGFVMGGGAAAFSPSPDFGRTADEMRADYGFVPRNVNEILALSEIVKQRVKEAEKVAEKPVEIPTPPAVAVTPEVPTPERVPPAKPVKAKPEVVRKMLDQLRKDFRINFDPQVFPQESMGFGVEKADPDFIVGVKDATPEESLAAALHEVGHLEEGIIEEFLHLGEKIGLELTAWQAAIDKGQKQGFNLTPELITKIQPQIAEHVNLLEFPAPPTPTEPIVAKPVEAILPPEEFKIPEKGKPQPVEEIGEGEELPRGTSVSVLAQAIESEIIEENKTFEDEIPTYRAMNMKKQAEKAAKLIEDDIEQAKRVAFYEEAAPPGIFPENIFTGLRVYAKQNIDVDLIMDLALNQDVVREHTIMGKRIKSLDTDQDYADPVRAIREIVETRKEEMMRKGKDVSALEVKLRELQTQLDEGGFSAYKGNVPFDMMKVSNTAQKTGL